MRAMDGMLCNGIDKENAQPRLLTGCGWANLGAAIGDNSRRLRQRDETFSRSVNASRGISAPMAHTPPQECCARAKECERLAETATNPETREMLLYLAKRWRDLADDDEAKGRRDTQP
jgi:hypothetical protein